MDGFWGDDRLCALDGAFNFRDIGGYPAGDVVVRTRRLYRAGMLTHLADHALDTVATDLGIRTVIDLRSPGELALGLPEYDRVGLRHVNIPINDVHLPDEERAARFEAMRTGTFDWAPAYRQMIEADGPGFRTAIEQIAVPGTLPAVIHCAAGRDRTGVTIALILGSLGVSHDDIAADYALSGDFLGDHAHRFLAPHEQTDQGIAFFRTAVRTQASTMHHLLDWISGDYGSVAGVLAAIGVSSETISALRHDLLT